MDKTCTCRTMTLVVDGCGLTPARFCGKCGLPLSREVIEQDAYTVRQTASMLGLPLHRVYAMIHDNEITATRPGHEFRISKAEVMRASKKIEEACE